MDFLVSPTGPNANNLNSAYYQSFSLENRYINFAVNLGKLGEGAASFQARYGALSLFDATRQAYATIFGATPTDAKLHAILDPTVTVNGHSETRADYFAEYGGDGLNGIGTKAAMAGWLMAEGVKADVGMYAKSNDAFLTDLADGALFAVDIVGTYGHPEYAFGG
jgi:serralysin